jgi:hypothetical protein
LLPEIYFHNGTIVIKNLILFLLAALLIGLVVWSGMKTLQQDARWLLVFGLTCAFLAPVVLEIFVLQLRKEREQQRIEKLYKVADINELIDGTETMEEKVRLLSEERLNLSEIIRTEAYRQASQNIKQKGKPVPVFPG